MTETLQASSEATACYIEIRLSDGERITARVNGGEEAARAELAAFHSRLDTQTFVLVGEDTVVRSDEVRFVQLTDEGSSGGFLETVKDKLGGGTVTNYQTEQRGAAGGGPAERREDGGFTDQWVGYGNRPFAETKPFFMTSEFLGALVLILAILIATAINDNLDAPRGWLYAAIVGAAYILSRGFAKSGTRDPNPDRAGYGARNR